MIRPRSEERTLRLSLTMAGDALIAWGCLALVVFIRRSIDFEFTRSLLPPEKFPLTASNVLLTVVTLLIALGVSGFYSQRFSRRHRPFFGYALVIQTALVAVGATLMVRAYPRTILFGVPLIEAVALPLWRYLFATLGPVRARETVLIGRTEELVDFLHTLGEQHEERVRVMAVVAPSDPRFGGVAWWGSFSDAAVHQRLQDVEEVIYLSRGENPEVRLRLLELRGPKGFLLLPSQADALLVSASLGWVGDQPLVEIAARCGYGAGAAVKRAMDLVLGSLFMILSLPFWLVTAIAIVVDDGRPVLLRQTRTGRDGEPFGMLKFRTMYRQDQDTASMSLAKEKDHRVTRVGSWLRRHRLDEVPQLLNVIRGDMSLVGPRPERPEIVEEIGRTLPGFDLRHLVRPGLAGLAQVSAEYDTRAATKLRYDLTYICAWSLALDLRIMLRAVTTVLSGRGV